MTDWMSHLDLLLTNDRLTELEPNSDDLIRYLISEWPIDRLTTESLKVEGGPEEDRFPVDEPSFVRMRRLRISAAAVVVILVFWSGSAVVFCQRRSPADLAASVANDHDPHPIFMTTTSINHTAGLSITQVGLQSCRPTSYSQPTWLICI